MSAIIYFRGPIEPEAPTVADADGIAAGHSNQGATTPVVAPRILPDFKYLAERPVDYFDINRPVTACDRCLAVIGVAICICGGALVWSLNVLMPAVAP